MTRTWVGAWGLMSRNATVVSVSRTIVAGMLPATILQNRQSSCGSPAMVASGGWAVDPYAGMRIVAGCGCVGGWSRPRGGAAHRYSPAPLRLADPAASSPGSPPAPPARSGSPRRAAGRGPPHSPAGAGRPPRPGRRRGSPHPSRNPPARRRTWAG